MTFFHLFSDRNRIFMLSALTALSLLSSGCARTEESGGKDKETAISEEKSGEKNKKPSLLVFDKPYKPEESNLTGAFLSSRFASESGDFDNQSKHAARVFSLDSKDDFIKNLSVRSALIDDDFQTALALSKEIEKNAGGESGLMNAPALLTLITEAFEKKDYMRAQTLLKRYAEDNLNILVHQMVAQSVTFAGNTKLSEKNKGYEALASFSLFRFFELYHQGLQEKIRGKNNQLAEKYLSEAVKVSGADPLAARAALTLADLYIKTDRKKDAEKLLEKTLDVKPVPAIRLALQELRETGKIREQIVNDNTSLFAETLFNIGVVYARESEPQTALTYLNLADYINPGSPAVLSTKGELYQSLKDHNRAIAYFKKLIDSPQSDYRRQAILQTAYSYSQIEQFDAAESLLKSAIEKEPNYHRYPFILGDFYRVRERYEDALTQYNQALSLLPERQKKSAWKLYYARGVSYERLKNWKKAEVDLIRALDMAPNNPEVINYLAYSWLEQEEQDKYDEALILLEKAVEAAPENAHITDSLGWAYFKKGDYERAVEFLERALDLAPGDPVINDHLGDAYYKSGRVREAMFQWRHAADFKPDETLAKQLEQKIKTGSLVNLAETKS